MKELEKIIDIHTNDIKEMKTKIDKLFIELTIFINENKHLRELMYELKKSLKNLIEQSDQAILRFKILDNEKKRKTYFWEMIGKHWWKFLAIGAPFLAVLHEIEVYLRNLPLISP